LRTEKFGRDDSTRRAKSGASDISEITYWKIRSCDELFSTLRKPRFRGIAIVSVLEFWRAGGGRIVSARWRSTRSGLLRFAIRELGEVRLANLTVAHVIQIQQAGLAKGLSPTTINKITHHALAAAFRDANVDSDILTKVARLREPAASTGAWTIQERNLLIAAADLTLAIEHSAWLRFVFFTGVRLEESLGLRWSDIDFDRRTISIARSRFNNEFSACKTRRSQRVFVATADAIDALRSLHKNQPLSDLVFLTPRGRPFDLKNFRRRQWTELLKRVAVPRWPLRCTRHTFATALLDGGVVASQVAFLLGDNPGTVLTKYAKHTMRGSDLVEQALAAPPINYPRAGGGGAADARVPGGN
jgi:integrase